MIEIAWHTGPRGKSSKHGSDQFDGWMVKKRRVGRKVEDAYDGPITRLSFTYINMQKCIKIITADCAPVDNKAHKAATNLTFL